MEFPASCLQTLMAGNSNKKTNEVLIGMGGWELPDFNNVFYPAKLEKGFRKLEYFSFFFDLVEVNSTFYNTSLTAVQSNRWLKDVGDNSRFMFTIKLYRGFTHTFDATQNDALAIHRLLEPLRDAGKLSGLVIQFPSSFVKTSERQAHLIKLRTIFPEDRLFLDLRHISWNDELFYQFYRENGFHLINVDLPRLPGHMPLNSYEWDGIAYFRMMGRNAEAWNNSHSSDRYLYRYSEEELLDLIQRIRQANARKTYVVFHNDRQAFSLVNGRQVEHLLYPQKSLTAPENLLSAFPQLKSFCIPNFSKTDLFSVPGSPIDK
jgi:uncharacterized protein YecE (DUF72 family)